MSKDTQEVFIIHGKEELISMNLKKWWLLFVLSSISVSPSFANGPAKSGWFVGAQGGWIWPNLSNSSTTVFNGSNVPAPNNSDLYTISKHPSTDQTWGFYAGHLWTRSSSYFPFYSLAFRYQRVNTANITGTVDQYSLPNFVNYNYNLHLSSNIFSLLGKFNIYQYKHFSPYVSLGIGESSTQITGYTETAAAGIIPRVSPGYQGQDNSNFTYSAGVGIDYFFNPQLWASLGYEYAYLGTVNTGKGTAAWSNQSLSLGKCRSNSVFLGISYQLPYP